MKFDGTVHLGHILTLVAMLGAVAVAFFTLDRRVSILETTVASALVRIDRTVDRIEEKLDRKQDRTWR